MLKVKFQGKMRHFPSRRNFNDTAYLIVKSIKNGELPYVVFDVENKYLFNTNNRLFNACFSPYPLQFFLLHGKSKECGGLLPRVWQSCIRTPTDQEIRDDLAQALASLADEEREFIFAYYRKNASQKRRERFQRKERNQRRNDEN